MLSIKRPFLFANISTASIPLPSEAVVTTGVAPIAAEISSAREFAPPI